jgi:glutamate-1-semialdehyde aminotransferase
MNMMAMLAGLYALEKSHEVEEQEAEMRRLREENERLRDNLRRYESDDELDDDEWS